MASMASPRSKTGAGSDWLETEQSSQRSLWTCVLVATGWPEPGSQALLPAQTRPSGVPAVQPDGQPVQGRVSLSPRPRSPSVMRVSLLTPCGEALSDPMRSTGAGLWEVGKCPLPSPPRKRLLRGLDSTPGFQWGAAAYFSSFHSAEPCRARHTDDSSPSSLLPWLSPHPLRRTREGRKRSRGETDSKTIPQDDAEPLTKKKRKKERAEHTELGKILKPKAVSTRSFLYIIS